MSSILNSSKLSVILCLILTIQPNIFADNNVSLESIEVIETNNPTGYSSNNATIGTKTDTPIINTPMIVEALPNQVIKDKGITSSGLTDMLSLLGVQTLGLKEQGDTTIFRGFTSSTTLWNGFRIEDISTGVTGANGSIWMDNVDQIEVIKGPASILYGRSEPGGMVNVITKKPLNTFGGEVNLGAGSWSDRWVSLDIAGPIDKEKKLLYRLNVAQEDSDSLYTYGQNYHSFGVAPAFTWILSPSTTFTVEGQYRKLEGTTGQSYIPIDPNGNVISVDPKDTLMPGNDNEYAQNRTAFTLEHKLNAEWLASLKYMHNDVDNPYSGYNYILGYTFPITNGELPASLFNGFNDQDQKTNAAIIDFTGKFTTLGLSHTLLVGSDYYKRKTNQYFGWDFSQTTDYFHPTSPTPPASTDFWTIDSDESSLYFQDQIQLSDIHLLLGGRYQSIKEHSISDAPSLGLALQDIQYTKKAFLPQFGLLWNFTPTMSAYYSYSENIGANTGIDYQGQPLRPEWSKQNEIGLKAEWFNGKLNGSFALFDLTKTDLSSEDPAHPGFNIAVGEVESKGFELNLQGSIADDLEMIMNYSYARPLVIEGTTQSSIYSGPSIVTGELLPYVSNQTFSAWTRYDLPWNETQGWKIGGGYNWASDANPQSGATIMPESYQIVSVFAAYQTTISGMPSTLQLNVNNLFNEEYLTFMGDDVIYGGNNLGGYWGTPRQIKCNLRVEF